MGSGKPTYGIVCGNRIRNTHACDPTDPGWSTRRLAATTSTSAVITQNHRAVSDCRYPRQQITTFANWYKLKFSSLPAIVHVLMWVFYGYLWDTILYLAQQKGKNRPGSHAEAADHYRGVGLCWR